MMLKRIKNIDNRWFFTELPPFCKVFLVYVRGDLLVLFPFIFVILLSSLISIRFMIIMMGIYIAIRQLGEMIYWFSHQFGQRDYRPYDFGFRKLNNHAIYIIYQTLAIVWVVFGLSLVIYELFFYKAFI